MYSLYIKKISTGHITSDIYFVTDKARKAIEAGGFYINLKKVENPDEVLSRTAHVLPNNVTVIRVGSYTIPTSYLLFYVSKS